MTDSAIEVEDLGKKFGDVVALDGVSFDVPTGTVLGLLGPNGAGKTTAVRILTTILRPDRGRATVLGHDVVRHSHAVRTRIGLAGQYAAVDENLTARENLAMMAALTHQPPAGRKARADELLATFALADAADRPVRTFSGGMRRRLDLAAALVHRPPVLFLDEPTTGLDPRGRSDLWGVIAALVADGTTLLLTTQYLEEAERLADRILVIDVGHVIASGTAEELKRQLGGTVLRARFDTVTDARQAQQALAALGAAELDEDDLAVDLPVPDAGASVVAAVRLLDEARLTPAHLVVREPTLDDVFLQLTGARSGGAA